jgi:hypothetical protein
MRIPQRFFVAPWYNVLYMTQKAFSLDNETIQKIAKGFAISLGGALLAGFVVLSPEVTDYIAQNDPVDWRLFLLTTWGAFSTGVINMVREYIRGV